MLSAGKIASELDASPKEVNRIIKEERLEPDLVRRLLLLGRGKDRDNQAKTERVA